MLRLFTLLALLFVGLQLFAQQTLTPRIAVYNTDGERYVVDSVKLTDSVLVLQIGDLSFEIAEERFARLEPIPGATFSDPDQIYSISLKSGKLVVGQVLSYRKGLVSIRTGQDSTVVISREDIQGLHREKRNAYAKPYVKHCATTNFISSPYALNAGEIVFTSNIYANTLEVGMGNGFSAKLLSSIVPFVLPTGYEISYKRKLENSNFSVGLTAGQIWVNPTGALFLEDRINSNRDFVNIVAPSFTYHMGNSYVKSGVSVFSGSTSFSRDLNYLITSTYSMPGIRRPHNKWNISLVVVPNNRSNLDFANSLFLAGYQIHAPKASYTFGLGLARANTIPVIPIFYAYFSLYSSKEQKKIAKSFDMHKRMKVIKRTVDLTNARAKRTRERETAREARRQRYKNK